MVRTATKKQKRRSSQIVFAKNLLFGIPLPNRSCNGFPRSLLGITDGAWKQAEKARTRALRTKANRFYCFPLWWLEEVATRKDTLLKSKSLVFSLPTATTPKSIFLFPAVMDWRRSPRERRALHSRTSFCVVGAGLKRRFINWFFNVLSVWSWSIAIFAPTDFLKPIILLLQRRVKVLLRGPCSNRKKIVRVTRKFGKKSRAAVRNKTVFGNFRGKNRA